MKRVAVMLVVVVACAGTARAQSAPTATSDSRWDAEFTVGPTFGHKASVSLGGEIGWWLTDKLGIYGEGGRILNVASSEIESHAAVVADYIGGSADVKQHVNYFDAGVKYRLPPHGRLRPYALFGVGAGTVFNDVTFNVAGADVTGSLLDQFGVALGSDLSGHYNRVFITTGFGTRLPLTGRWVGDLSYRYGYVGKNADANLKGISTNRLQFGVGLTF